MVKQDPPWVVHLLSAHPLAFQQFTGLLEGGTSFVVEEFSTSREETQRFRRVFVIDAQGLKFSLKSTIDDLRSKHQQALFVVITAGNSDHGFDAWSFLLMGIRGWVFLEEVHANLLPAVRAAIDGSVFFPAGPFQAFAKQKLVRNEDRDPVKLTGREEAVYALLQRRLRNEEIAERLGIKRTTVKSHVSRILSKLGVTSRRELASDR